jgi:hypothetical protein
MGWKSIKLILICLVFTVSVSAQKDENNLDVSGFVGKWILIEVRQIPGKHNIPLSRDDSKLKIELEIRVSGKELHIDEKVDPYSRSSKHFLDGRGETNPGFTTGFVYDTVTNLKDGKIIIVRRLQSARPDSQVDEQEWQVSADGGRLEIRTRTTNDRSRVMQSRGIETARPTQIFKRI